MANKVKEDLIVEQEKERTAFFLGKWLSIFSLLHGISLLFHDTLLSDRLNTYFLGVDQRIFGATLVLFGIIKIVGIYADNRHIRIARVVGLSIIWGMLFVLALMFSFGIGYPSTAYISNGVMLAACLRISYRGRKNERIRYLECGSRFGISNRRVNCLVKFSNKKR